MRLAMIVLVESEAYVYIYHVFGLAYSSFIETSNLEEISDKRESKRESQHARILSLHCHPILNFKSLQPPHVSVQGHCPALYDLSPLSPTLILLFFQPPSAFQFHSNETRKTNSPSTSVCSRLKFLANIPHLGYHGQRNTRRQAVLRDGGSFAH